GERRRDERDRPDERFGRARNAQRAGDDAARPQHDERADEELQPRDHSVRPRSSSPARMIQLARRAYDAPRCFVRKRNWPLTFSRSAEHTSELQSLAYLV